MTNHAEFEDLCAAFALGALDAPERDRLRDHLQGCADCRQRVSEFAESSTWVALGLAPIQPSAAVKSAVMARISGQHGAPGKAQAGGGAGASPGGGPGLLVYVALAVAGLAVAGAVAVGYLHSALLEQVDTLRQESASRQGERDLLLARLNQLEQAAQAQRARHGEELARLQATLAERSASLAERSAALDDARNSLENLRLELASAERELERLRRIERLLGDVETQIKPLGATPAAPSQATRGRVLWNERDVVFVAEGLPRLNGKSYELWVITPGGGPQKAGLLPEVDAAGASLALQSLPVRAGAEDKFAVSVEPAGGSPGPGPTGDVILITP